MSFKIKPKLFFGTIFVLSIAFAVQTFADNGNIIQTYKQLYTSKTPSLENWANSNGEATVMFGINQLIDIKTVPNETFKGLNYTSDGKKVVWIPGGAIGTINQTIASLYQSPASGIEYIAQIKDGFLGKPAYAQSNVIQGLQPLLPIWRAFRNIVYMLSSIFFIIIGVMIILRVKISPQAVITIQNAIPQLIITLILVTFSYAIAGLVLDVCNVFQGLIISTLFSGLGKSTTDSLLTPTLGQSLISKIFGGNYAAYNLNDLIARNGFLQTFDMVSRLIPGANISLVAGLLFAIVAFLAPQVSAIILLILLIIILVKMVGLFISLIKAYITILLKIILAPIEIGIGAFPGSKMGFSSWLTDLIANAAIFPICLLFLVIVNVIMEIISNGGGLWTPPLIGDVGTIMGGKLIAALFGLGAFMLLSKLPDLIPQVIFALKPSPWGQAIGQSLAGVDKIASTTAWQGSNMGLDWITKGGGSQKVTNIINKIPGVTVTTAQVDKAASTAKAAHNTLGGFQGQKFPS